MAWALEQRGCLLSWFSLIDVVMKLWRCQLKEEKVYLASKSQPTVKGSQGRNVEAEAEAETTEECYLLVCYPWLARPTFLCTLGPHAHGGTTLSGLQPSYTNYQSKKRPSDRSTGLSNGCFLFLDDPGLCQVNKSLTSACPHGKDVTCYHLGGWCGNRSSKYQLRGWRCGSMVKI